LAVPVDGGALLPSLARIPDGVTFEQAVAADSLHQRHGAHWLMDN